MNGDQKELDNCLKILSIYKFAFDCRKMPDWKTGKTGVTGCHSCRRTKRSGILLIRR